MSSLVVSEWMGQQISELSHDNRKVTLPLFQVCLLKVVIPLQECVHFPNSFELLQYGKRAPSLHYYQCSDDTQKQNTSDTRHFSHFSSSGKICCQSEETSFLFFFVFTEFHVKQTKCAILVFFLSMGCNQRAQLWRELTFSESNTSVSATPVLWAMLSPLSAATLENQILENIAMKWGPSQQQSSMQKWCYVTQSCFKLFY